MNSPRDFARRYNNKTSAVGSHRTMKLIEFRDVDVILREALKCKVSTIALDTGRSRGRHMRIMTFYRAR